jgi:hypothetical protein
LIWTWSLTEYMNMHQIIRLEFMRSKFCSDDSNYVLNINKIPQMLANWNC